MQHLSRHMGITRAFAAHSRRAAIQPGSARRPAARSRLPHEYGSCRKSCAFECLIPAEPFARASRLAAAAAQPLSVHQICASTLEGSPIVLVSGDCGAVVTFGAGVIADHGPAPLRDGARPGLARPVRPHRELAKDIPGVSYISAACCRLHQIGLEHKAGLVPPAIADRRQQVQGMPESALPQV